MELVEFFQNIKTPATVVHVISVILGMGAALMSDVLFSFFSKDKKLNKTEIFTLSILAKAVLYGLVLIIFSGIIIFFSDVEKYISSAKFLAKMTILIILVLNGYLLNKYVWPHLLQKGFFTNKKERGLRKLSFICGAISVISWLSVCTLGVIDTLSISYTLLLSIYIAITLFGVAVSLLVEKKEFN